VAVACLQAGPFDEQQVGALRSAVAGLPAGSWRLDGTALPSRWMVYIGRLADADAVRAKRAELRALGWTPISPARASSPAWPWGAIPPKRRPSARWAIWAARACAPRAW
jgi:hypothetical protein